MEIKAAISKILLERGLTQAALAQLLDVRPWTVGAWISGERGMAIKHHRRILYLASLTVDTDYILALFLYEFTERTKGLIWK